jgi:hypothetical protein
MVRGQASSGEAGCNGTIARSLALADSDRLAEAVDGLDEFVRRFEEDPTPELQEIVLKARATRDEMKQPYRD